MTRMLPQALHWNDTQHLFAWESIANWTYWSYKLSLSTIIYLKKKYLKAKIRMAFAYGWPAYDSRMKKLDENEVRVRPPRMTLRMTRVWQVYLKKICDFYVWPSRMAFAYGPNLVLKIPMGPKIGFEKPSGTKLGSVSPSGLSNLPVITSGPKIRLVNPSGP